MAKLFSTKKTAQAHTQAELKKDLESLLILAKNTEGGRIEHRKELYVTIQNLRNKYSLDLLPSIINSPDAYVKPVHDLPYSFINDDGTWANPKEDWMKSWVNKPTEIGACVTDKVTPYGSWLYWHKSWVDRLIIALKPII